MSVAAWTREPVDAHFTEGEPDLEPPEELAVGELDEDAMLEEELDNEDVLEQDVDEDTLEVTLEDLVHSGDDEENADGVVAPLGDRAAAGVVVAEDELDGDDLDADVEEGLDLVLLERLALVGPEVAVDDDEGAAAVALLTRADAVDVEEVPGCRADEFVCRSCFLVRNRVQLAGPGALLCRDCAG